MIKSFRHKALERFFLSGYSRGIASNHIVKIRLILAVLNAAKLIGDIESMSTLGCHALKGNRSSEYAVKVNKNWRITFEFNNGNAYDVNYEDYHDGKIKR